MAAAAAAAAVVAVVGLPSLGGPTLGARWPPPGSISGPAPSFVGVDGGSLVGVTCWLTLVAMDSGLDAAEELRPGANVGGAGFAVVA